MASVRITAEFADGDNVEVCIEDDNPSPDCLDHMRRQAVDAFLFVPRVHVRHPDSRRLTHKQAPEPSL